MVYFFRKITEDQFLKLICDKSGIKEPKYEQEAPIIEDEPEEEPPKKVIKSEKEEKPLVKQSPIKVEKSETKVIIIYYSILFSFK